MFQDGSTRTETKIHVSLFLNNIKLDSTQQAYDEKKCKTKADIAKMVVGIAAGVAGAGAAIAGAY